MAIHCQQIVKDNNFTDKMKVIVGKVEEVMKIKCMIVFFSLCSVQGNNYKFQVTQYY